MREMELLKWILHGDFLCKGDVAMVMVESQGREHDEQRVVIVNKVSSISQMALYRFDEKSAGKDFLPFFNDRYKEEPHAPADLRSFCDYILLAEYNDMLYVILIELKRGEATGYRKQIDASHCFVDYIIDSAERIKHENAFDEFDRDNIRFRRVLIKKCTSEKQVTHNSDIAYDRNDYIEIKCNGEFRPIRVF